MLNKKIQLLETIFAEFLADGVSSVLLGKIRIDIQMWGHELEQLSKIELMVIAQFNVIAAMKHG